MLLSFLHKKLQISNLTFQVCHLYYSYMLLLDNYYLLWYIFMISVTINSVITSMVTLMITTTTMHTNTVMLITVRMLSIVL